MKILLSILCGVIAFFGVFYLDSILIDWILQSLPSSAVEWLGIIKIILWFVAFCWTFGVALLIGYLTTLLLMFLITRR